MVYSPFLLLFLSKSYQRQFLMNKCFVNFHTSKFIYSRKLTFYFKLTSVTKCNATHTCFFFISKFFTISSITPSVGLVTENVFTSLLLSHFISFFYFKLFHFKL